MKTLIDLMERGILPDALIRLGIRRLNKTRLRGEDQGSFEANQEAKNALIDELRESPIAIHARDANRQHYELPPAFFKRVLGRRLKYSSCYWPMGVTSLDQAEEAMLDLACRRAELEDGMDVLELGCGWGSMTFWIAEKYPNCRILAVSNSRPQREFIEGNRDERGLSQIEVQTADMNTFGTDREFDRVVSIEMFEHMRNYRRLMANISRWLKPEGKLFLHIFTHRKFAYPFETEGDDNWLGRYFFTGGLMPSDDLLLHFQEDLVLDGHWGVDGTHYAKTAEAWLRRMDDQRDPILDIMRDVYGPSDPKRWFQRWRVFFMACAELWACRRGREWLVSHYRFQNRHTATENKEAGR